MPSPPVTRIAVDEISPYGGTAGQVPTISADGSRLEYDTPTGGGGGSGSLKTMQTATSGAQNGSNKTYVWEAFLTGTETFYVNGVAVDPSEYTATPATGTIVLGVVADAPIAGDQVRMSYMV